MVRDDDGREWTGPLEVASICLVQGEAALLNEHNWCLEGQPHLPVIPHVEKLGLAGVLIPPGQPGWMAQPVAIAPLLWTNRPQSCWPCARAKGMKGD